LLGVENVALLAIIPPALMVTVATGVAGMGLHEIVCVKTNRSAIIDDGSYRRCAVAVHPSFDAAAFWKTPREHRPIR